MSNLCTLNRREFMRVFAAGAAVVGKGRQDGNYDDVITG